MNLDQFLATKPIATTDIKNEDVNKGLAAITSQVVAMSGVPILRMNQEGGKWEFGPDREELTNTRVVAIQSTLQRGYVCWYNSQKEGEFMESMFSSNPTPRAAMADLPAGQSWTPQLSLDFIVDSDLVVRFSTSSEGGKESLAKLAGAFLRKRQDFPAAELYDVDIGSEFYINKRYGNKKTYKPVFTVVACRDKDGNILGKPELSLL